MPFGRVGMDGGMVADTPEIAGWRQGSVPLLRATFTAADGMALGSYVAELGGAPTVHVGTWDINSNRARLVTPGGIPQGLVTWDAGRADVWVSQAIVVNANGGGVVLRLTDSSNFWLCQVEPGVGAKIFDDVAGVFTARATTSMTITNGNTYLLSAHAYGATIDFYVDGVLRCTYGSATFQQTATRHGFRAYGASVAFDNFLATTG